MLEDPRTRAATSPSSGGAASSGSGISPSAGIRRPRRCRCAKPSGMLAEQRFRALGVRLRRAGLGGASRRDRRAGPRPRDVPLAVRPADPRPRPRRGALGLRLPARDVRAEGEARVRLLRAADARRRPASSAASSRASTGRRKTLELLGAWGDTSRLDEALREPRPPWLALRRHDGACRIARMDFETRAIHEGQEPDPATGAVTTPIYQTSTYVQEEVGVHKGYDYSRVAQPDADGAAGVPRLARGRRPRPRVLVRARRDDDAHAPGLAGRPRRRRERRLRRRLPHVLAGLRAEGLRLRRTSARRDVARTSPRTSTSGRGSSGSRRRRTRC